MHYLKGCDLSRDTGGGGGGGGGYDSVSFRNWGGGAGAGGKVVLTYTVINSIVQSIITYD